MARVRVAVADSLMAQLVIRGAVLFALCLLATGCTAGASSWETAHANIPLKTSSDAVGYIGW